LGRHSILVIEGVVGVDVGVGKSGREAGFYARATGYNFRFARIADGGIDYRKNDVFVVERGGTFRPQNDAGFPSRS